MTTERPVDKLALLVGSNPLPNYIAATVLKPREAVLLYSPETEGPRDRLRDALVTKGLVVTGICIDDATNARRIADACASLHVDHLHYSGGTKPMAAHARKTCRLAEAQASYLDERRGLLRYDDGYEIRLDQCDLGLTLDLLLALHGMERIVPSKHAVEGPAKEDLCALATRALADPDVAAKLREHFRPEGKRRSVTQSRTNPWMPLQHGLSLSAACIPGAEWTDARYDPWEKFLTGGWLEMWTAGMIQSGLPESPAPEVSVNCRRVQPPPTSFEIDVSMVRGHRLYVASCTTDRKKPLCKSKLFEVSMRARQMGGDLARSALFCLMDGGAEGTNVEQLRSDIASLWDAPNVPQVFGRPIGFEWAKPNGGQSELVESPRVDENER